MKEKKSMYLHKVSVREFVEYVFRSGDITSVNLSHRRMVDGTKAHQRFQKAEAEREAYESEVSIDYELKKEAVVYRISGRIDGVITRQKEEGKSVIIDEIKSTTRALDDIEYGEAVHWAQVKVYAYLYALQHRFDTLTCRLTYIELETHAVKQFQEEIAFEVLADFFAESLEIYSRYAKMIDAYERRMHQSIKEFTFPFENIRSGQDKLMRGVYRTIREANILFSRAPTGTGKTIATLFPGIKALGEACTDKLFYLTAKNIGKKVAVETLEKMKENKLTLKYVVITAKEKICIHDETNCNPEHCPYARGHYDRINEGIEALYMDTDAYTREVIEAYARTYQLCPYELSLDLASLCQVIICDYNYAFDPSAMLKRFFAEGSGKYTLLIDEAHNLVDRSRSMYSAELTKSKLMEIKGKVKSLDQRLHTYFTKANQVFIDLRKEMKADDQNQRVDIEAPLTIETHLRGIIYRIEKIFKLHKQWEHMDLLLDFYFAAYDFIKKYEMYGPNYRTYYIREGQELRIKLFCVDPRTNLREILLTMKGVVYFSATLLPMPYYRYLLGGDDKSFGLDLLSPFKQEHLKLLVDGQLSTKYADREQSLRALITKIGTFVEQKQGNYLIYFPSYTYMNKAYEAFVQVYGEQIDCAIQEKNLLETEKEAFIERFSVQTTDKSYVAFAVLGGMFGEGIDLIGEKLLGAVIVGVGLPMICFEQDIIKDYFNQLLGSGFDYAYTYPGMNKVLQAAGRVIRTEEDRGSVLLIDRRFNTGRYKNLYPVEWSHMETIRTENEVKSKLRDFWDISC